MFGELFHSYVLSQVFGLYLLFMAVILLSRTTYYRMLVKDMPVQSPGLLTSASYGLMLGLLLVVIHNTWVWEPRVLVTLIAWFIVIKSLLWLAFPEKMLACTQKAVASHFYYVIIALMFIMGILMLTKGFYFFIPGAHVPNV